MTRGSSLRSRTSAALAAVLVVIAGSATSVVPAPAMAAPAPSEEAASFARERGISVAAAEQRLGWQAVAPDLLERLPAELGERFGGVWIDGQGGDRVKVGLTGSLDPAAATIINRAATALGLGAAYDVVLVARSAAALERSMDRLGPEIARVNTGAPAGLAGGVRPDLNALWLGVPSGATADQLALVETTRQALGSGLVVGSAPRGLRPLACAGQFCDPPLRGGIRVTHPTGSCTGGFLAKSKVDNELYQFTAGHCGEDRSGNWSTQFTDGSAHVIGAIHHWEYNASGDAAILSINNEAGWSPAAQVRVTPGAFTTENQHYGIAADKLSVLGMRICATGAFNLMSWCGFVMMLNVSVSYTGPTVHHLGWTNLCSVPGDSGAPMYAKHNAYGILVAGNDECSTLYQGIRSAETLLNVDVLHG
ncbi:S1 family peptidase [Dactylosporangium sp. NPDC049525]|uniref:S1 family peptidase n=1 Tax=Dactylosporangium sp. NPDC049525 TaxID=3154730 RepID=UPI0034452AA4